MTDLSVWDEEDVHPRAPRRRRRKKKERKGGLAVLIALLLVVAVIGGGAALVFGVGAKLKDALSTSSAPDYPGPGTGEVVIEVKEGQTVSEVGVTLKDEDVIKSTQAFFEVANADPGVLVAAARLLRPAAQDAGGGRARTAARPVGPGPVPGDAARGAAAGRDPEAPGQGHRASRSRTSRPP